MDGLSHSVLDPAQLVRIEATHGGFLYQHLFGVAQLLAEQTDQRLLIVEHDEDIELVTELQHVYIQVKRYSKPLQPNDIEPILARFELLRQEHAIGHRIGRAEFFLVSASEASPSLAARVASPNWPMDVRLVTPSNNETVRGVPAWRNLSDAIHWTIAAAHHLQFCRLDPATLVWKLATHVQLLATGYHGEHSLRFDSLPTLREQLNLYADHTPPTPQPYRPQRNEPAIRSESRIRIIEGVSGAGKTSWAAAASDHIAAHVIWVHAETGIADVPSYLVRKIAARRPSTVPDLCRPGMSPMESLRILDQPTAPTETTIVVDNAHLLDPTELARCIRDTTHVHWCLLTHPGAQTIELAHRLGVRPEVLEGWSNETVAAAISALGVVPHPSDIQRLRQITGGLPLFVEGTARIACRDYGGNLSRLLANYTDRSLATALPQETLIAKDVLSHLSTCARDLISHAACLRDKIPQSVLRRLGTEVLKVGTNTDAAIRELTEWSVIQPSGAATVVIHDVFRPALELARAALAPIDRTAGLRIVLDEVQARQAQGALMVDVFMDKLRIQAELGDANSVADSVHHAIDWLCEFGAGRDIELLLVDIFNTHAELSTKFKLLTADALTTLACKRGDAADALRWIKQAEMIACALPCADSEWIQRLAILRVSLGRLTRDYPMAQRNFRLYSQWAATGSERHRVARYNFAAAANEADDPEEAFRLTTEVINEYYQVLDLRPD